MTFAAIQPANAQDEFRIHENPAVARCFEAWDAAYKAHAVKHNSTYACETFAAKAFRRAMPHLAGHRNICDFIACVGYGMLNDIIDEKSSTKLLYAAQVALTSLTPKPKTQIRDIA